jgi:hypothetical protein
MREMKFKFVLGCDGVTYCSSVVKTLDEMIGYNFLLDELIEDGGCKQGNIAFNDAFMSKDWVVEYMCQFTGFSDSKRTEEFPDGQEIYEHDLLEGRKGFLYKVVFENGAFYLYHANRTDERWGLLNRLYDIGMKDIFETIKVVGNIFESQTTNEEIK